MQRKSTAPICPQDTTCPELSMIWQRKRRNLCLRWKSSEETLET